MKTLSAIIGLSLLAFAARAALPQPDLIAQIHFAGAQKISADAHSAAFTNEFCSPAALAVRAQTADKLSGWLAEWLQTNLNATVAEDPVKLRPLFDDLQTSEWFLEARTTANGKPAVAVAIKLDPARAQFWQAGLKPFFAAATFKSAGGWLIFDSDPSLLNLGDGLAQKILAPRAAWLDLDVNWPRLAQWHPALKELALPETQFTVTAPDNNFHINGKFYFPENLALKLDPWRVPMNTVHEPFDSFTAVRGFAAWFQSQKWAQPFQLSPVPNQFLSWSLMSSPFQTYAVVPVPDAVKAISQFYAGLGSYFVAANARHEFVMPMKPEMTNNGIYFRGLPFIDLHLRALSEPAGHFLFLGLFPNTIQLKLLSPGFFSQLATNNLVYYHWELTSARMPQMLELSQFGLMFTVHKQLAATSATFKWLHQIGPTLGNTDTEITQSGPAEFTFTRKAPGVLTAAEFYTLGNWLEATNFPGCDLKLPPRPQLNQRPNQQPIRLTTPVLPLGH